MFGATRGSCSSGRPIQKSRPSGSAISSRKNVPSERPVDPADDLADEVPEGERVVAVPRARLPERLLARRARRRRAPSRTRPPSGIGSRNAARPAWWFSSRRTGMPSLPCLPNSGQYVGRLGRRGRARPRAASRCAQSAVAPLVHDQTRPMVSRSHAAPVAGSATPPQRSTTVSPSTVTQTDRSDLAALGEVPLELLLHGGERGSTRTVDAHGCIEPRHGGSVQ